MTESLIVILCIALNAPLAVLEVAFVSASEADVGKLNGAAIPLRP